MISEKQKKHINYLAELKRKLGKHKKSYCLICGKQFFYYLSSRPTPKYCSRKCQNNDPKRKYLSKINGLKNKGKLSGNKNPHWKGGITSLAESIRKMCLMKKWRSEIYKRDKYICQKCGDKKGKNLNAHHKITFAKILKDYSITSIKEAEKCKILWDIDNGITLCELCHIKEGGIF